MSDTADTVQMCIDLKRGELGVTLKTSNTIPELQLIDILIQASEALGIDDGEKYRAIEYFYSRHRSESVK